jgi:small acid-soluble spore protein F (minor alpha/beta-type SASP)
MQTTTANKTNHPGKMKKKKKKPLTPVDKFKIEVAKELGLWSKIKEVGWAGLSAAETGQIGGYMTRKMRQRKFKNLKEYEIARLKRCKQHFLIK